MISEKKLLIGNVIKISWLPLWKPAGELVMPLSWSREPSNSELLYCHLPSDWFAQNEDEQSHPSAQIMVLQIAPKLDNHRNTAHKCSGHNSAPDEISSFLFYHFFLHFYLCKSLIPFQWGSQMSVQPRIFETKRDSFHMLFHWALV